MRVVHALTTSMPGGTEMSVLRLLPRLESRGIGGVVSILRGDGPMVQRFEVAGIRVYRLSAERGLAYAWRRFCDVLRRESPDVVHTYGFAMGLLGRLAARRVRPRPATVHGIRGAHLTGHADPYAAPAILARVLERGLGRFVDRYVANSESAVEFLVSNGLPRGKFMVVRNGIDVADWPVTTAARGRRILCVAGLRPVKRVDHLLDALAALYRRRTEFTCVIAGDGTLRSSLEQRASALGLGTHVEFRGRVDPHGIRELLGSCRLLILPSMSEGMPVSVMEGMASGVPVVACDVPGVRDLVVHGETGLLVPAHDAEALAAAIETLLTDPDRACRLGAAGRERVAQHFSFEAHLEAHVAAYRSITALRHAGGGT